jgi:hypothetical protein
LKSQRRRRRSPSSARPLWESLFMPAKIRSGFARRSRENIPLLFSRKSVHPCAVLPGKRGGSRSSRNARWDAVDADAMTDEAGMTRTAKSCGPGAAVLASSWREVSRRRRWQESRSPGRARYKPQSHCAGKAGCLRWTCMLVCVFFVRNCTRDRGCSVHPVFPAPCSPGG